MGVSAASVARAVRERPILFAGRLVRAILAGEKTQTRRVMKRVPRHLPADPERGLRESWVFDVDFGTGAMEIEPDHFSVLAACPYGTPGDRLWVREAWAFDVGGPITGVPVVFRADGERKNITRWKPSIHLRKAHSRLTLEVVSVRVERLQEISEADAKAEGVEAMTVVVTGCPEGVCGGGAITAREQFAAGWDTINGRKHPWASNPWVWVVEFRRVEAGGGA